MSFLMSDILSRIRTLSANELEDLSSDEAVQNTAIFGLVTVTLREMAKQANNVEWSDALNIASNSYQTFLRSTTAITDMFQPIGVYDVSGTREEPVRQRTSFDLGNGWYRESDNQKIHTYGLTGNHKLQYIRYPAAVTASGDMVEIPLASQKELIMRVIAMIKLIKNFYQESEYIKAQVNPASTVNAALGAMGKLPPQPSDKGA
jgi:hypothetical protein